MSWANRVLREAQMAEEAGDPERAAKKRAWVRGPKREPAAPALVSRGEKCACGQYLAECRWNGCAEAAK